MYGRSEELLGEIMAALRLHDREAPFAARQGTRGGGDCEPIICGRGAVRLAADPAASWLGGGDKLPEPGADPTQVGDLESRGNMRGSSHLHMTHLRENNQAGHGNSAG